MIHTPCHTSICSSWGIHVAFFSVLRARKGKNLEKNYCTNTWSKIFLFFKIASSKLVFINQMALIGDDLIRKYLSMQKFIQ